MFSTFRQALTQRAAIAGFGFVAAILLTTFGTVGSADARQIVAADVRKGTVLVRTGERNLYYGLGNGRAIRYKVAVGRAGKQWTGTTRVRYKRWRPAWSPTPEIRRDNPNIPRVIPGGAANNPMGDAAIVLARDYYAIHGTNRPSKIGQAVSYGCIRMTNADIADLYPRVRWFTKVTVTR